MTKTTLITGATAGIGEATARLLAKNGYNLIVTGRRKARLDNLKKDKEDILSLSKELGIYFRLKKNSGIKLL